MTRARCLWWSSVLVVQSPGAVQRVPATYLAQGAIVRRGGVPFPARFVAPAMDGPQCFVGVAEMSPSDVALTRDEASRAGGHFFAVDERRDAPLPDEARAAIERATGEPLAATTWHEAFAQVGVLLNPARAHATQLPAPAGP